MTTAPTGRTHGLLARVEHNLATVRRAEFERLELGRGWALENQVADPELLADPRRRPTPLGAVGLLVDEYAPAEFAAALELHPLAGRRWMADGVDIHDRLPSFWSSLARNESEVWVARKVAAATGDLSDEQARWVDAAVADVIGTLPPGRLLALVAARVVEADQALAECKAEQAAAGRVVWMSRRNEHGDTEQRAQSMDELRADAAELLASPLAALKLLVGAGEIDCADGVAEAINAARPSATRPRAMVYLHLTRDTLRGRGVTRAEEVGALTRQQLIDLLGHHQVSLRPVIDLNEGMAADCYEVPAAIDERLQLAKPADVFPFASSTSRRLDRDHTRAYDVDGPPGQTVETNLGKLTRHHHRIKTHGGWSVEQRDRRFTWTSPHGRVYVTDGQGTHHPARSKVAVRVPDLFWSPAA